MFKPVEVGYICALMFQVSQIYIVNGFLTFAHKFHGFDFKINAAMQFKPECCTKKKIINFEWIQKSVENMAQPTECRINFESMKIMWVESGFWWDFILCFFRAYSIFVRDSHSMFLYTIHSKWLIPLKCSQIILRARAMC